MPNQNLRHALDSFAENVRSRIPTTLHFDGDKVYLTAEGQEGKVGIIADLTDDTVYRLVRDDVDDVAEEMEVTLTDEEREWVKKGIEAGLGNCWWDVIHSAINDVVTSRRG